jgi:hypothetical protein
MRYGPAELPLPGGASGATLKLHPLLCAQVGMPPNYLHRRRGSVRAPVHGRRAPGVIPLSQTAGGATGSSSVSAGGASR